MSFLRASHFSYRSYVQYEYGYGYGYIRARIVCTVLRLRVISSRAQFASLVEREFFDWLVSQGDTFQFQLPGARAGGNGVARTAQPNGSAPMPLVGASSSRVGGASPLEQMQRSQSLRVAEAQAVARLGASQHSAAAHSSLRLAAANSSSSSSSAHASSMHSYVASTPPSASALCTPAATGARAFAAPAAAGADMTDTRDIDEETAQRISFFLAYSMPMLHVAQESIAKHFLRVRRTAAARRSTQRLLFCSQSMPLGHFL